jgi:RNA polymerase sigma-70 factor (ECF subfamily)
VALTSVDRDLLRRCLSHKSGAWNDFVDRFLGLIYHVINHTAQLRSTPLQPEDVEDLAAEILLQIVAGDYAVLRQFREKCSLATYLTIVARRICVHELARKWAAREVQPARGPGGGGVDLDEVEAPAHPRSRRSENLEEVEKLLRKLSGKEREVVRLYYLEERSYEEISTALHIPVNSVGAVLSRAREKLRKGGGGGATTRQAPTKPRDNESRAKKE